jgi:mono/diheme cytochrome c family protein
MKSRFQLLGPVLLLLAAGACSRHKAAAPAAPAAAAVPATPTAEAPVAEASLSYELRLGRGVYQHHCQTCHGETGSGDGFNAFNVDPHPRDLSDPAFQKAKTDADLKDAIQRGGLGVGLSAMMPPYGKTLSPEQVDQVVEYLRTLKRTGG